MKLNTKQVELQRRVKELETENKKLRRQVIKLEGELNYLNSQFVGSKRRKTFHRPNCKWAACISPKQLIEFSSHQEAVEASYKPCKTCRA
jgi:methylphosphotriester-DNA--protein-cysteine methyltransferase